MYLFEDLNDNIKTISRILGLPGELKLPHAKSNFRKVKKSYRDLLDREDKEEIASLFSKEIKYFGYVY